MSSTVVVLGSLAPDATDALRAALGAPFTVITTATPDSVPSPARYLVLRNQPRAKNLILTPHAGGIPSYTSLLLELGACARLIGGHHGA